MSREESRNLVGSSSSEEDDSTPSNPGRWHKVMWVILGAAVVGGALLGAAWYFDFFADDETPSIDNCSTLTDVAEWETCLGQRKTFFEEAIKELPEEVKAHSLKFHDFLLKHQRDYYDRLDGDEFIKRLFIFNHTMRLIDLRNARSEAMDPSPNRARHGVTQFADWTEDEFKALLGGRQNMSGAAAARRLWGHSIHTSGQSSAITCPTSKNWAIQGQIRNQGQCGNCWTFSTAETIRNAYIQQHGDDPGVLSTQYITDCMIQDKTCQGGVNGCCGGNPDAAMEWLERNGGIPTQAAYGDVYTRRLQAGPVSNSGQGITYSGNHPTTVFPCKSNTPKAVVLKGRPTIMGSEGDMENYVCNTGALSVILDASEWNTYVGGVMSAAACGTQVDHAVMAVGVDKESNAWVVQNSWGPNWGVSVTGVAAPHDMYSNCAQLAGHNQRGCKQKLTTGQTVAQACGASCSEGGTEVSGGFIFVQYGTDACAITTEPVAAPQTEPAR